MKDEEEKIFDIFYFGVLLLPNLALSSQVCFESSRSNFCK